MLLAMSMPAVRKRRARGSNRRAKGSNRGARGDRRAIGPRIARRRGGRAPAHPAGFAGPASAAGSIAPRQGFVNADTRKDAAAAARDT